MIGRLAFVFAAAALLAGCTDADWDHAMAYAGLGPDQAKPVAQQPDTAAPATPQAVAAAPDEWCAEVAKASATQAAADGFDAATQKHRAEVVFQQCAHAPADAN